MSNSTNSDARVARHVRLRKRLSGSTERPRLAVFRSSKHIYVQVIDDVTGQTVAAASSQEKGVKGGNVDGAKQVGNTIAKRAQDKGIKTVVFDRGGFQYHGRVQSLADGAREGGLEF